MNSISLRITNRNIVFVYLCLGFALDKEVVSINCASWKVLNIWEAVYIYTIINHNTNTFCTL